MTPQEVLRKHVEENKVFIDHINNEIQKLWREQKKLTERLDNLKKEKKRLAIENEAFQIEIMKMEE